MEINTRDKILQLINSQGKVATKEIVDYLALSRQAVAKQLSKLLEENKIYRIGKPPKVFYAISRQEAEPKEYEVDPKIRRIIENNFLAITPAGEIKKGWDGFVFWCQKRKQDIKQSSSDYYSIIKKYNVIRKNGLIDGIKKLKNTFSKVYLNNLFYLDFYAIEHFGKTKLGQMLLYAKQSQDKKLIKQISEDIQPKVKQLIEKYQIKAVCFIPPTVKREVQFMKELERNLNLKIAKVKITKIKTPVIIPQKTLNKLEDRVENAQRTFVVENQPSYDNILLIDDAVGSGATLNEIAKQIKERKIAKKKIIGLVITGSLKGFDVISEV